MKERPILFSGPMVRAILDGTKTQTRRVVDRIAGLGPVTEFQPSDTPGYHWIARNREALWNDLRHTELLARCPFGQPSDRLWVITLWPIAFGAGKYAVGDDGNVYDISGPEPRRRKPAITEKGYEEISLRAGGDRQNFRVNRLIAEAFYGQAPANLPICRHLDGDRRNNRPENLDWGTDAQNTADANAKGAWSGAANGGARLSAIDVQDIRESIEPQAVLAGRCGVTQPTISKIKSGKRWRQEHPLPPPQNLPRWASRITLEITNVRVERLQDISPSDCMAEGVQRLPLQEDQPNPWYTADISAGLSFHSRSSRGAYLKLWESINGPGSWDANSWVWVIEFKRVEGAAP